MSKKIKPKKTIANSCEKLGIKNFSDSYLVATGISKPDTLNYIASIEGGYTVILVKNGDFIANVNVMPLELGRDSVLILTPECTMYINDADADIDTDIIHFSKEIISQSSVINHINSYFVKNINLDERNMMLVSDFFSFIRKRVSRESDLSYPEIVPHLINGMISELNQIYKIESSMHKIRINKGKALVNNFFELLYHNFKKEHLISFYSEKLNVTPNHLSYAIKHHTSNTAGWWIDNVLVLDAERELKYSNKNIITISQDLGFPNQSFFGKFFKKHRDMSPSKFKTKYKI